MPNASDVSVPVEPMIVCVGKQAVQLPRECCCCGAPADHEEKLERKKRIFIGVGHLVRTVTLNVPCCGLCGKNVRWYGGQDFIGITIILAIVMLFVSVIAGTFIGVTAELFAHLSRGAATVVQWFAAAALFGLWLYRRSKKLLPQRIAGHTCSTGAPVRIRTFDANTTTLEFRNHDYGRRAAALNEVAAARQSA